MQELYEALEHDYRLSGFQAATEQIEDDFFRSTLSEDMLLSLATHHSADDRDSYLLFFDRAAIWDDAPGQAEYVALHITRDTGSRTFDFAVERAPVLPLAQNWLVQEGCPPDTTLVADNHGPRPADALTSQLEARLRTDTDGRYEVLDHFTDNPSAFDSGTEVRTLTYDHHPDSTSAPYRLFLEETDKNFQQYTVREGAFPSAEAADEWAIARDSALPFAPAPDGSSRAQAAHSHAIATAHLAVPPAPDATPRTLPTATPRPRGRAR
ncbi:hypothetical protein ACTWJ8_31985 [Streptomyces sp. SDT5-1]|uniref:hypothetical protein n=1 Tax=Streptomyces sp. SDT5-1 TaxID=3406418 RepID=UPI003FD5B215